MRGNAKIERRRRRRLASPELRNLDSDCLPIELCKGLERSIATGSRRELLLDAPTERWAREKEKTGTDRREELRCGPNVLDSTTYMPGPGEMGASCRSSSRTRRLRQTVSGRDMKLC